MSFNLYSRVFTDHISFTERKRFFILIFLIFVGSLLEMIGIGIILPLMAVLSEDDFITKSYFGFQIFSLLKIETREEALFFGLLSIALFYLSKTIFLIFLAWEQANFIFKMRVNFSKKLFTKYIGQDYEFFFSKEHSELIRNITSEMQQFANLFLSPLLVLIADILVVVGIFILLLIIEPIGALVSTITFSLAMIAYQLVTKKRLKLWGIERQTREKFRLGVLQQALRAIKEIKFTNAEKYFLSEFSNHNLRLADAEKKFSALASVPRLWIELVGILCIVLIISILLKMGNKSSEIIPILGLFAAAAFRLLPSFNRILRAFQFLRYANSSLVLLDKELRDEKLPFDPKEFEERKFIKTNFNKNLKVKNLSYVYPNSKNFIFKNVNFNIEQGKIVGIVGESGSGKTTLVDTLLGLLKPTSGTIKVDGRNIYEDLTSWKKIIGYSQQDTFLINSSIKENIGFGENLNIDNEKEIYEVLKKAELYKFLKNLPEGIETKIGENGNNFSGGQIQRLGIARALFRQPEIYIFDEPTSALDQKTENKIFKMIYSLVPERTVIIISHSLKSLAKCDKIFKIQNAKIIEIK